MGQVRKPLLPDGPIRVFFDRLHELHLAAGRPSMRDLQRRTREPRRPHGINPTTIHDAFAAPRLARWETVQALVGQLGGDVAEFAALWRAGRAAEIGAPAVGGLAVGSPAAGGLAVGGPAAGVDRGIPSGPR